MLDWLPPAQHFGARLRDAARAETSAQRARALAALSHHRLDFLETIQLARAMNAAEAPGDALRRHRLAIVGSATLDHLVPGIKVGGLRRNLWIDVHCGGYGQYRQEILDSASSLHGFAPQTIVFSIAAAHVVPDVDASATAAQVDRLLESVIDELRQLWRRARADFDAHVIQQTFLNLSDPLFGNFDRLLPGSPWRTIDRLNQLVTDAAAADGVALLDIARACERDGREVWFDPARMLQAKQEIAPQAAPLYGELLARVVGAQLGLAKKCLVLDLDNTIWGGVLGDDGVPGLALGQGSAAGEAYLAVQRYARQLRDRGIVLAVCSKNDPKLAEEAFATHPEMVLKRSDIAVFVANWQDKARNLIAIANELNIGIDSLVFLDDNPAERARIREALPDVAVPELPDDVSGYVRRLADAGYFEAVSFTTEDRQRAGQYAQNAERDALRNSAQSMDEFLQGLQMSMEYQPFASMDLPRITQLINKTNQFNPTTRRYSSEQITKLANQRGALTLQVRLRDRFGDNGLVSAMLLMPVNETPGTLEIDTWVMSCRVFGRQLEHEVMNVAVERARRAGARRIVALYAPTLKNGVIRDLYPSLGFRQDETAAPPEGSSRWRLELEDYRPAVTHIVREARAS
jgi:FkbH-like protein